MTNDKEKINLYKIIKILSQSMDLISETIVGHHQKVAYISLRLGESLNLTDKEIQKLVLTALVHDLGVFYLNQQFSDLGFETKDNKHALVGYLLSKNLFPLKEIPEYIKYHHHEWEKNKSMSQQKPPVYSHILFLADRISVLIEDDINILNNTKKIKNNIKKYSNKRFWPRGVDEFLEISSRESFWLDVISQKRVEKKLNSFFENCYWSLNWDQLLDFAQLTSHIIDFRSTFTATHSQGIASVASRLAQHFSFSKNNCQKITIAGHLHDIGKLIIPPEVLNKPGDLNDREWNLMKSHTYYTYECLDTSFKLEDIKEWGAYHHEKINGNGYPFRLKREDLSLGSKIMAVADVFTALTEDRPYREEKMNETKVSNILKEMSENKLDKKVVNSVLNNFEEFNTIRLKEQKQSTKYFQNFRQKIENIK